MSFRALAHSFRIDQITIGDLIYMTCNAIWDLHQLIHMSKPIKELFNGVASDCYSKWEFADVVVQVWMEKNAD